jgi:hypothetical protein
MSSSKATLMAKGFSDFVIGNCQRWAIITFLNIPVVVYNYIDVDMCIGDTKSL